MKIKIVCAGKVKENYYKDAIAEYVKRMTPYASLSVLEVEELTTPDNLKKEGEKILEKLEGYVIVMDRQGESLSSEQFAHQLKKTMNTNSTFTFVLGSSKGLSQAVKHRANLMWSFGAVTLPHSLARVVLVEQLYRAFTILDNKKYHQ